MKMPSVRKRMDLMTQVRINVTDVVVMKKKKCELESKGEVFTNYRLVREMVRI